MKKGWKILVAVFADDIVLLASLKRDLWLLMELFKEEFEACNED